MISITEIKSKALSTSGFAGYDYCLNPYVGCQFGCKYCYARQFVVDQKPWGEFVRVRGLDRLASMMSSITPTRLAIGTACDPYQPAERVYRRTRSSLQMILACDPPFTEVGIWTRCPRVLDDVELIQKLPGGRVHFTITPYPPHILKALEPIPIPAESRFKVVKRLKDAGIRTFVNISPIIPLADDSYIEEFAAKLAELKVNGFVVDPVQAYKPVMEAMHAAMQNVPEWPAARALILDKLKYMAWKKEHNDKWVKAWKKVQASSPDTLAVVMDHATHTKTDIRTNKLLDWKNCYD